LLLRSSSSPPSYVALSALCKGWTFSPNKSPPLRPIQCRYPQTLLMQVMHNTLLPGLPMPTALPPISHSRVNLIHSSGRNPILVALALQVANASQSVTSDDSSTSRLLLSSLVGLLSASLTLHINLCMRSALSRCYRSSVFIDSDSKNNHGCCDTGCR